MDQAGKIIHLDWAHERNILGQGIGIAVIDTGIYPHTDFIKPSNRIIHFIDFVNERQAMYDDCGHGTHVSGIIGGNGSVSAGRYTGIAPKCNIISVKVLNHKGNGNVTDVINGLKWVIENKNKYNIKIVNISVGTTKNKGEEESLLVKGVDEVWDSGIVVVVAAGNNGPRPMSIGAPGISRKVITVGAMDDNVSTEISGGKKKDYSGRGPTGSCIKKPDVVAPGSNIISCNVINATSNLFGVRRINNPYTIKSGTSMATPIVTGAVALLLSNNRALSPKDVKMKLRERAVDLGYSWTRQGWGLVDIENLLK